VRPLSAVGCAKVVTGYLHLPIPSQGCGAAIVIYY
jgi:hypothetical protein